MKFAQHLQDTQIPEWKKAYIDYRGLKKCITKIRREQEGLRVLDSPLQSQDDLHSRHSDARSHSEPRRSNSLLHADRSPTPHRIEDTANKDSSQLNSRRKPSTRGRRASFVQGISTSTFRSRGRGKSVSSRLDGTQSRPTNPLTALPLRDLLPQLSPSEMSFFTMLDGQLDKVESFYVAREKEMLSRGKTLQDQLNELNDHKMLVMKANQKPAWSSGIKATFKSKLKPKSKSLLVVQDEEAREEVADVSGTEAVQSPGKSPTSNKHDSGLSSPVSSGKEKEHSSTAAAEDAVAEIIGKRNISLSSDYEDYVTAKKKLKKAVREHYRGLEVLYNYRVLNITGFGKALKKFEKTTKIPAKDQYMTEKVRKSAFASDKAVRAMMKEMEDMFAIAFVGGDKKKAMARLRGGHHAKSHHFSTFRSGIFLGLAVPALVSGLVKSFDKDTRQGIPGWDGLLFIYGVFLVPVLFAILVGLNLLVWARSRINYVFIFELDPRTRLDYREYFEIPSILLAGLCYAFWLSFMQIGAPSVSPTIWPLVWLAFTGVVMFDPFPLLFKPSRYWLVKSVGKLLISGTRRVEFTDFWMGDQFCSLIFTLSNLYLFVCIYVDGFTPEWRKCGVTSSRGWPVAFTLAALPLLVRLVQSIKRYADSRLSTHLINGGKYGTGIISYFFYFLWRHQGNGRGTIFALWCLFNCCYSIYASSWDLLMDWSVLRPHAQYLLLRDEIVYSHNLPLYYFAIISNVLIRFIWVLYIPTNGPSMQLRTFIGGMLEILRRWQWNFYRLENEHLGNMDQYRVTREVPLPYSFDDAGHEEDADDDRDDEKLKLQR